MARSPRPALAVLVAAAVLLGACGGGDDDDAAPDADGTEDTRPALVDDACELLTFAQLDAVTGLQFDGAAPSTNQCIYTSSKAQTAIALNLFTTGGKSADEVVTEATAECDPGTASSIESSEVAGGYGCLVAGVVTVAVVTHDDRHVILTGSTQQEGAQTTLLLQQLSQLLAEAVLG